MSTQSGGLSSTTAFDDLKRIPEVTECLEDAYRELQ